VRIAGPCQLWCTRMRITTETRPVRNTYYHMSWPSSILVESEGGLRGLRKCSVFPGSLSTTLVVRWAKMSTTTKIVEGGGLTLECGSSTKPPVVNCSKPPIPISDLCDHELVVLTHTVWLPVERSYSKVISHCIPTYLFIG
jgi:hypothetical protein